MNAIEIEEAISKLAEQPFDPVEFPYAFLGAFGNKDTTLNPVVPREWFLIPLYVIDDAISKIRSHEIIKYRYDPASAALELLPEA